MTVAPAARVVSAPQGGPDPAVDRVAALTDLLVGGGRPRVTPSGMARAEARITGGVRGAVADRPLRVDRFRLARHGRDGPSPAFVAGPSTLRRAVGLDAVDRCRRGAAATPVDAVGGVLADAEAAVASGQPCPWWAERWSRMPAGERAVSQAAAVAWATRLWTGIDWVRLGRGTVLATRDQRWRCPTAAWLTLHGRVDVRVGSPTPGGGTYLVVSGGVAPPRWEPPLALPVLVAVLARGPEAAPGRVVGWWPDSGQVRVAAVDDQLLDAVASEVAQLAADWWRHAPDGGPVPGRTDAAGRSVSRRPA